MSYISAEIELEEKMTKEVRSLAIPLHCIPYYDDCTCQIYTGFPYTFVITQASIINVPVIAHWIAYSIVIIVYELVK